jgi:hypothetical protein
LEFLRRHKGKLVASLLITVGIWAALHKGGLKIVPEGSDFDHVKWWTIPCYLATLATFNWFRSVRWRFLLRGVAEVPKKRLLAVSWVGFAAILLMPFRIGEFVRPYMLRTRPEQRRAGEKVITMTAATSSIVAERVLDGLYLSIVLALALVFVPTIQPLPDKVVGIPVSVEHVRMSGYAMLGLFCVGFATLVVFYFAHLWREYGAKERPVPEDGMQAIFEHVAGVPLGDLFDAWIRSAAELDPTAALARVGLTLERTSRAEAPACSLGVRVRTEGGRGIVASVTRESSAARAGIDAGDELLGVGGARVEGGNVEATLRGRAPGDAVDVLVARDGRILTRRATLDPARLDVVKLVANRDAPPASRAALRAWLGSPHPAWEASGETP